MIGTLNMDMNKKRTHSLATRQKISQTKRIKMTNEIKEKIRKANLNKKQSQLTKDKRSQSLKLYWAKKKLLQKMS